MNELNPEIQRILDEHNIDPAPQPNFSVSKNPVIEDFFKTLGDCLRPIEQTYGIKPKGWRKDQEDAKNQDPCT